MKNVGWEEGLKKERATVQRESPAKDGKKFSLAAEAGPEGLSSEVGKLAWGAGVDEMGRGISNVRSSGMQAVKNKVLLLWREGVVSRAADYTNPQTCAHRPSVFLAVQM